MANKKRLIDANEIVKIAEHAHEQWCLAMVGADDTRKVNEVFKKQYLCKVVKAVADNAPTVDAVEVVRCKDCTYWKKATANKKGFLICPANGMEIMATDFCSYGERREA